jgi:hypothetical protein
LDESEESDDEDDVNIWDEPPDSNDTIRFDSTVLLFFKSSHSLHIESNLIINDHNLLIQNDIYILSPGRPTVKTREVSVNINVFQKVLEY